MVQLGVGSQVSSEGSSFSRASLFLEDLVLLLFCKVQRNGLKVLVQCFWLLGVGGVAMVLATFNKVASFCRQHSGRCHGEYG